MGGSPVGEPGGHKDVTTRNQASQHLPDGDGGDVARTT